MQIVTILCTYENKGEKKPGHVLYRFSFVLFFLFLNPFVCVMFGFKPKACISRQALSLDFLRQISLYSSNCP